MHQAVCEVAPNLSGIKSLDVNLILRPKKYLVSQKCVVNQNGALRPGWSCPPVPGYILTLLHEGDEMTDEDGDIGHD